MRIQNIQLWNPIKGYGQPREVLVIDADEADDGFNGQPGYWMLVDWQRTPAVDPLDNSPIAPVFLGETKTDCDDMLEKMAQANTWNTMTAKPID